MKEITHDLTLYCIETQNSIMVADFEMDRTIWQDWLELNKGCIFCKWPPTINVIPTQLDIGQESIPSGTETGGQSKIPPDINLNSLQIWSAKWYVVHCYHCYLFLSLTCVPFCKIEASLEIKEVQNCLIDTP